MKKLLFRTISLTLIITHLWVICLRDVSFAEDSASSSAAQESSSSAPSSAENPSPESPPATENSSSEPKEITTSAFEDPDMPGLTQGETGFNLNALKSLQNDPFTGRATFSVPIAVPPGRRGMQPNLALSYASGAGNGILGIGWSLELGAIERSTKKGVPTYNDTKDTFIFNSAGSSAELVNIGGQEYRPKIEGSFSKFIYNGASWTIIDKTGTKYYFGSTSASRQEDGSRIFKWCLDKAVDLHGNSLTITYTKDQNQIYPLKIEYTGNEVTTQLPQYTVNFVPDTEDREDITTNFRSGFKITTARRIKQIEVKYNNELVRKYVLDYQYNSAKRSLLSNVTQYGQDGITALPAIRFNYQQKATKFDTFNKWEGVTDRGNGYPFGTVRSSYGNDFTAADIFDMNGDGLADRVLSVYSYEPTFDHFDVQLNNGSGFATITKWETVSSRYGAKSGWNYLRYFTKDSRTYEGVTWYKTQTSADILDINGDGLPDRIMCPNVSSTPTDHWDVQLNNGSGFGSLTNWGGVSDDGHGGPWSSIRYNHESQYELTDLLDINGDGLPDRVMRAYTTPYDHFDVQLNNGSGFDPVIPWGGVNSHSGTSSIYCNIRFSYPSYTGPYTSRIYSNTCADILDINGDGLPDRVMRSDTYPYDHFDVQLNNGRGFDDEIIKWEGVSDNGFGWPYGVIRSEYKNQYIAVDIFDINGDGLPDRVLINASGWYVQLNNGKRFESVIKWEGANSEYGSSSAWAYMRSFSAGVYTETYADILDLNGDGLPDRVMRSHTTPYNHFDVQTSSDFYPDLLSAVENGLGGKIEVSYTPSTEFDNTGSDDISDLPFPMYVVSKITSSDGQGNSYSTNYAYKDGFFDTAEREFRGFGYVKATDAEGTTSESYFKQDAIYKGRPYKQETKDSAGKLFSKAENTWANNSPYTGVNFPYLAQTDNYIYDGDVTFKQTSAKFEYDLYGNPLKVISEGEVGVTGDEKTQITEYTYNTSNWLLSSPKHTYLLDQNQTKVSEKWFYYDGATSIDTAPSKGQLTKEEARCYNPLTTQDTRLTTQYSYDSYGNLISSTDALGRTTTTEYETNLHAYPTKVTNTKGHSVQSTYDYKTGQALTSTDPNNQTSTNVYDALGRLIKVIGPNDTQDEPGVIYEYDLTSRPIKITKKVKFTYNLQPNTYYLSFSFFDGLGRTIQTKSPAEDDPQTGQVRQIISDIAKYDSRGQLKEKYFPYYLSPTTYGLDEYAPPIYDTPHAILTYDAMGRLIQTTNPDTTYSTVAYSDWVTTATDENGHYKTSYVDAYGRVVKVEEHNGTEVHTTTYEYDTQGNLIKVTDNQNNITQITYDSLGRKIKMDDPDMGVWTYEYDKVGNLIKQTDAKGQILTFEYDSLNRLIFKRGLSPTGTVPVVLVAYFYDDPAKTNCKGRLSKVVDKAGTTEFFYDALGREVKSTKTISGSGSFAVERTYDALDRLITLKYPDGEVVTYTYNPQGIERVTRTSAPGTSAPVNYVSNIDYSPTSQITKIKYGNGAETSYAYDPNTLRLTNLVTQSPQGKIQDLSYQFDKVGNVKELIDSVNTATQSFLYDDLDRLIQASGTSYGNFSYAYDSIGNMIEKEGITLTYGKNGKLPHAVTQFGDTLIDYDANGNMIKKGLSPEGGLSLTYDIENRLSKAEDKSNLQLKTYNLQLTQGWNFLSLPVIPQDLSINAVLSSIQGKYDQVSRYNSTTKQFEHYVNDSQYNDFDAFEYGIGYQIYITDPSGATLSIQGLSPQGTVPVSLKTGYNLISCPKKETTPAEKALAPLKIGVDYEKVLSYDKANNQFIRFPNGSLTELEPGKCYYLKCLKDTTWQIDNSPPVTTFVYDGDGGRVKKVISHQSSAISTTYIGSLFEKDSDGTLRKHIFFGSQRVCTLTTNDQRLTTSYFHSDHLGSSNVITDESGNQAGLTEFTPYGSISKQTGTYDPKHKFTGKELDSTTGLYFYGARYYSHELGRFITADTIVQSPYNPQTLNRYSYCNNNPINYVDPTGHSWWSSFWHSLVGTFIGGVVTGVAVVFSGGALAPFAPFIFGAVSGAVTGGISGGWQGMLIGAGMGLATAGAVVYGGPLVVAGLLAAGAGLSYATGGWAGVGDFAAGLAGSIIGGTSGYGVGKGIGNAIKSGLGPNLATETGSAKVTAQASAQARGSGTKTPVGQQGQGSPTSSLNANKGASASESQALSSRGTQSEPDVIHVIKKGAEPTGYRYVGPGEAAEAANTGYTPNTNVKGDPKSVFYTPEDALTSASQARSTYNLPNTPTHRIGLDTTQITNTYGGNVQGGTGIEMITRDKIPVVDIENLNK